MNLQSTSQDTASYIQNQLKLHRYEQYFNWDYTLG